MSPLWSGLLVTAACFLLLWLASLVRRDASLVDRWWGAGFLVLALWYGAGRDQPPPLAGWLLLLLVGVWGLRLSVHLTLRNWGHGEDYRYRAMRDRHGARFPLVSLGTVFLLQAVLTWVDQDAQDYLYYAVLDKNQDLVTPPLVFLSSPFGDPQYQTSTFGFGNAGYLGVYQRFMPFVRR